MGDRLPYALGASLLLLAQATFAAEATAARAPAGRVVLTIHVVDGNGVRLPAADAVAWLPAVWTREQRAVRPEVLQRAKTFVPHVAIVSQGSVVEFPNEDPVFHNVFSLAAPARFDLGLYRNGERKAWTFAAPGLVPVYCNIHPSMAAYVVVADSDVLGHADPAGFLRLDGVPPGTHRVRVWDERGGEWQGEVGVPASGEAALDVVLDASAWQAAPHKNKYGKDYEAPEDDDFRY